MEYIASVRVGLNDIKALVNLESDRRSAVAPLLNMRGNDSRYIDSFLSHWTDHPFFIDVSTSRVDAADSFLVEHGLLSAANAYAARRRFFKEIVDKNERAIPVASWQPDSPPRETMQFALKLERESPGFALRPMLCGGNAQVQWNTARNILDAVPDLTKVWMLLDIGPITGHGDIANSPALLSALESLRPVRLAGMAVISTSFPNSKPASGTSRTLPCLDPIAQSLANNAEFATPWTYGDYGGTNPTGAMEYIFGMPVLPFASYFVDGEWWQTRSGGDKEFSKYTEIAREIRQLSGYHSDDFCWATQEIGRIARGEGGTGNNGTWNGIRINQHICAMLHYLRSVGFPISRGTDETRFDDDGEL